MKQQDIIAKRPTGQHPIHWISFDLDHTLWNSDLAIARANRCLLEALAAINPTEHTVTEDFWQAAQQQVLTVQPGLQPTQRRQQTLRHIIQQWQLPDSHVAHLFSHWFDRRQQVVYYEEVKAVLDHLAADYSLIAVTNGNACRRRTGADRWFNHWISADDVGFAKPNPEPFQAALQLMQCHPSQVLHVGDHPHHDVIGAHRIGMQTAWVNRTQLSWSQALAQCTTEQCIADPSIESAHHQIQPTIEVPNLQALLTWLTKTEP